MTLRTHAKWMHHRKPRLELAQVWAVTFAVAACLLVMPCSILVWDRLHGCDMQGTTAS